MYLFLQEFLLFLRQGHAILLFLHTWPFNLDIQFHIRAAVTLARPSSENHPYFMELKETYKTIDRHGSAHGWHEDISGRRRCWQSGWRRRRLQSRTNKLCLRKLWRCSSFLVAQYSSRLLTCLSKLESIRFIEGSSSLQVLRVDLIGPRRRGTTFSQYHNVSHVVDASS